MPSLETTLGPLDAIFTSGDCALVTTKTSNPITYRRNSLQVSLEIHFSYTAWIVDREKSKITRISTVRPANLGEMAFIISEVERLFPLFAKTNEHERSFAEEFTIRQTLMKIQAEISQHESAIKKCIREREWLQAKLVEKLQAC